MKISDIITENDILTEIAVDSSWVTSVAQTRQGRIDKVVRMRTQGKDKVNREYEIFPMTRTRFEQWRDAPSIGRFWHENVKGKYNIRRIKKAPPGITYPFIN